MLTKSDTLKFECETGNYHTFVRLVVSLGYIKKLKIVFF
jgi:hypothetical protein